MKKLFRDSELLQILFGGLLLLCAALQGWLWEVPYLTPILFALALVACGYEVFWNAIKGVLHGQLLDETFLMSIASIGAFFIGEYAEGVAVMLFYLVGEYFEHRAVRRARSTIRSLMDINPDTALVLQNGEETEVSATDVAVGDTVILRPGNRIPVDCVVERGTASVDTSCLTGESVPLTASAGTALSSGMIVLDGVLYAKAEKTSDTSAAARILDLVQEAQEKKSRQENFITAFSHVYTPIVVGLAVAVAFLPPLILWDKTILWDWVHRALMFLVVSCPCALVISVPLTFFGGIGGAASRGILFKGGASFETLAKARIAAFDKTGTLTTGTFSVAQVLCADGVDKETLLALASGAEAHSTHPIARAIRAASPDAPVAEEVKEVAGKGVLARVNGSYIAIGNLALMEEMQVSLPMDISGTFVAQDGVYLGTIVVEDTLRPDAKDALSALSSLGVKRLVMLTGDALAPATRVAQAVGITEYHAAQMPQDKYRHIEGLSQTGAGVMFVGDGINDAPCLARADVGIAMGGIGSDAAIEAADVVITNDNLARLPEAISWARKVVGIARQNIAFALFVKIAVMLLAATGLLAFRGGMWVAVFADVGVALLAILNALRTIISSKH